MKTDGRRPRKDGAHGVLLEEELTRHLAKVVDLCDGGLADNLQLEKYHLKIT